MAWDLFILELSVAGSEVIRDADDRIVDVVVPVGARVVMREVERGGLDDDAAIFSPDIEAGAELVGDTAAVQAADVGVLAQASLKVRLRVVDGRKDVTADAGFEEGIEVLPGEIVDVGPGDLLHTGVHH